MVRHYSHAIVQEFYANMKFDIFDLNSHVYHRVYVHDDKYEFSLLFISSFLNYPIVKSTRVKELKLGLDMDIVVIELTGSVETMWPALNTFSSSLLIAKYSILHKITIANWLHLIHF